MKEPRVKDAAKEPEIAHAAFGKCLVDSDSDSMSRARRRRRKALSVSILVETGLLAVVILSPLMRTVAQPHLTGAVYIPFAPGAPHRTRTSSTRKPVPVDRHPWSNHDALKFFTPNAPPRPTPPEHTGDLPEVDPDGSFGPLAPYPVFVDPRPVKPSPPTEAVKNHAERRPLKVSEPIVQAQLTSRVEPRYPVLAKQTKMEGTVVLHAIIGRDGRISSLEVVTGHPLFVQAALDAVRQWRYRPTTLDGEPVEVETTITVIFRLQQQERRFRATQETGPK